MILVFGSINMDLVARVAAIPRPGETVLSPRADTFFGGKGANQAVAASRAGRGGPVAIAMCGAVGDDPFGRACLDNLRAGGIDTQGVRVVPEPTGCAFINVDDAGENAITVASGANLAVRAADVPDHHLSAGSVLVLQKEVPIGESIGVARRARERGARVVWNLAPAPTAADSAHMREVLAATHVLVVNEHEAVATGALLGIAGDHVEAASALARTYDVVCVVTAGARGALALHPDGTRLHAPARKITPVDSTGAGDTFVGVLALGLAQGRPLQDAMKRGCLAASLSCLHPGAQAGMPDRDTLEREAAPSN